MSAGKIFDWAALSVNEGADHLSQRPLKRKLGGLPPLASLAIAGYPSPPMSSPPSPPRLLTEPSRSGVHSSTSHAPVSTTTAASPPPAFSAPLPQPYSFAPPAYPPPPPYLAPFANQPGYYIGPPSITLGAQVGPTGFAVSAATSISTTEPSSTKTARKSKAHVASACVNCKRAHLSCDVQRPCARCVASHKQDSCIDVAHKKRGRPRLRDEGEFKIEQMLPGPGAAPISPVPVGPSTPRPIASTRHRRTESLRSLRSQTSEYSPGSGQPTPMFPPPASMLPPPNMLRPRDLTPAEIPTAFLDLDFVVIRANLAFREVISLGREISGAQIGDLVTQADGRALSDIRNDLRAEREEREPLYMPPIAQQGQDPLSRVSEADIERLSHSYADRSYRWARNPPGSETFPARVRLGKADIYFVAVTLPTFRPSFSPAPPPQFAMPPYTSSMPPPHTSFHGPSPAPHPPARYSPVYGSPPAAGQPPIMRSYGSLQMPAPYVSYPSSPPRFSASRPIQTNQPSTVEPRTFPAPFTPQSAAREPERRLQPALQLPSLLNPTTEPPGPSRQPQPGSSTQPANASDEDEDDGRRKRRKVELSDVLQ